MYAGITTRDDNATLKVTPVHDQHTPGVRLTIGPLYLSLDHAEAAELAAGLLTALAEIEKREQAAELVRDCKRVDADVAVREGL